MAVLAGFITSCSNEDIDIIHSGGLTVNVSTQNAFDELGVTQPLKEKFLSEGYSVGVYNYLYDNNGSLVASDSTYSRTLDMVSCKFDRVPKGSYTLITLEMIVNPDDKYKSSSWTIVGQEDLKTIEIKAKKSEIYWYGVIGLTTRDINIDGGDGQNVSAQPKGIGSIVQIKYIGFNESSFDYVAFYTKDAPVGRYLSPNYTGADRYEDDVYNPNRTWTTRGYIYQPEGMDQSMGIDVYLMEEGTVKYCYGATNIDPESDTIHFTSYPDEGENFVIADGNNYYGGLWYTGGSPLCNSGLFNTKTEYNKWYDRMEESANTIIPPYLIWGTSASTVDTYMTDNGATLTNSGTNVEESIYWTFYENSSGTISYEYQFELSKTNLNVLFMTFYALKLDQVRNYLSESFEGGEYDDQLGGYLYYSDETALLAYDSEDSSYVTVLFVPNVDESSTVRSGDVISLKNRLAKNQINKK